MESDWTLSRLDGRDDVVLVAVELRNPSPVDRRVRVENRLDGPVLPPRSAGVPDPGWDETGFAGVVPAGGTRALGYAAPASGERPPITVVDEGRASGDESASPARAAARELEESRPPADAVPAVGATEAEPTGTDRREEGVADAETAVPPPVEAWLSAVEDRVERGERLTDASVATATAELEGTTDVEDLDARLAADAAALRALSDRATGLATRASAVDIPLESLRRLA
jgi:hypothetical protein